MTGRAQNMPRGLRNRVTVLSVALLVGGLILAGRAVQLQLLQSDFLESRADAQQVKQAIIVARRGRILDRNGQPLAVSAPVDSFWAHPDSLDALRPYLPQIAAAFGSTAQQLEDRLARARGREFVWLKRGLPPNRSRPVIELEAPGLQLRREYRRYYPAGEYTGHLVGFADIDENGQEGLELSFDSTLKGSDGRKLVITDRLGRHVRDIAGIEPLKHGRDLQLGLDLRIQFLAYRELKEAVERHQARTGSIVLLDVRSGEVLAMASLPSFNPNDRRQLKPANYRNRAVLDLLEPGSTIKPLVLAAALEDGAWSLEDRIDTGPGFIQVGSKTIKDRTALGVIDFATLMRRSSQVGATTVALSLEPQRLWSILRSVGLARTTESGFPGEAEGSLSSYEYWRPVDQAVMAYGYGLAVTPLQLVRAYTVFANQGRVIPVSLLKRNENEHPRGVRVLKPHIAAAMSSLLEEPIGAGGTATRARIAGYRVAGKTGTVEKLGPEGYESERHTALFVGYAPASNPRIAAVVVIDEPMTGGYFGGQTAAPVFSRVVVGALRLVGAPMDGVQQSAEAVVAGQ
ncbi:peptidoglycan D,D-transpeptidase FtsI family protein [Candidatus Foliamicus sp.]